MSEREADGATTDLVGELADDTGADIAVSEAATTEEVTPSDELPAGEYCEATVDLFCPYYLRCGRMAVPDLEACRRAFIESCNARYEPVYAALAERGALVLSRAGIARCEAHLESVACEQQIFDLDGGCDAIWVGQVAASEACGLGIESFICDARSTCVIGLDFCGTCVALTGSDDACDFEHRCPDDASCVAGRCSARAPVGGPCGERACVLGATCSDGVCRAPTIVALGEGCDADRRCAYKATCVAGRCAASGLLGEPCSAAGCASGACVGGQCVPLIEPGAPCSTHGSCRSGRCEAGQCAGLTSACLQ